MNVDAIDTEIGRLRRDADTVNANLLELERNPNLELIDAAPLEGETARTWNDARRELAQVWQWHGRLTAFLDEAGRRRGTRARLTSEQEAALTGYLQGASIELTKDEVPLAERSLLSPSVASTNCTADELLAHMSSGFEHVRNVLFSISGAWDDLVTRVRDARMQLAALRPTVAATGVAAALDALDGLQARTDVIAETLVLDPLAVAPDDLEAVEQRLGALHREIASAAELRHEVDERLARARTLLDEVVRARAAAGAAHREVLEKVVAPLVPSPDLIGPAAGADLDTVEELVAAGRWHDADAALATWTTAAEEQLLEAFACAAANRAPLEHRDRLRGRLEAYRSMARRRGYVEDVHATELLDAAKGVLYTAPTDLALADQLVRRYRDAVAAERDDTASDDQARDDQTRDDEPRDEEQEAAR